MPILFSVERVVSRCSRGLSEANSLTQKSRTTGSVTCWSTVVRYCSSVSIRQIPKSVALGASKSAAVALYKI